MEMHPKVFKPLYWDILKTAQFYFDNKGFEETTVADICRSLNISRSQFSMYFTSLDEVLETLWSRVDGERGGRLSTRITACSVKRMHSEPGRI